MTSNKKVLFIGGTGNISWWCVKKCVNMGMEVSILNRRQTVKTRRNINESTELIQCDIRDVDATRRALEGRKFDVVCDFICYNSEQARVAVDLFLGNVEQYIVISSAANYDRRNLRYPITEDLPQYSEYAYCVGKIEMEKEFSAEYKQKGFPVTIVRPAQTYDTLIPDAVGNSDFTNAARILAHKPIILFGDGATLWTLTNSEDFANAFVRLIGNARTIGEAYHITSNELLNWREITAYTAKALGVDNVDIVYMPTDFIKKYYPDIGTTIQWHKMYCDIYDTSKIKSVADGWECKVRYEEGIKRSIDWLLEDAAHQRVNKTLDAAIDDLIAKYMRA